MRKITRRLTAAVLSACLALAPLGAFAEQPQIITAQVHAPMSDGTQLVLSVQSAITSSGETVYWLDSSMLSQEQLAALAAAQLVIYDEQGVPVGQYLLSEMQDGVVEMIDAFNPEATVSMMIAPQAMPETTQEIDAAFIQDGYDDAAEEAARFYGEMPYETSPIK